VEIPDVSNWTHQLDASSAECLIFTYKEGLLSTVAYDLKLRVEDFEVAVDEPTRSVAAIFNTQSIHVVTAMRDGVDIPGVLSDENKREIDLHLRISVLDTRLHPDIVFVSESVDNSETGGYIVRGNLSICGVTRRIIVPMQVDEDCYIADAKVHQPDFGITPYRGLMGTMSIRPTLTVRLTIPRPA
jgi:hypothetical protein